MKKLVKELFIFVLLFITLSLIVHFSSWISHPIEHIEALSSQAIPLHPLIYVFIVYIIVVAIRLIIYFIKKLFEKNTIKNA